MSRIITYGFFGEDEAQRNFLAYYFSRQFPDTFLEDDTFRWRIKVGNRDQVDAFLPEALLQKAKAGLELLVVGRDVDTEHEPTIRARRAHFETLCKHHQPVVLMLPVQCVEHWLWYIKRRQEEPGKNTPLESRLRPEAKFAVYAGSRVVETQLQKANVILANLDVAWLESRSESFRHFHHQVIDFLNAYAT